MTRRTPPPPGGWPGTTPQNTLDTTSSASRQHYIDTGTYLTVAEVAEAAGTPLPTPQPAGRTTRPVARPATPTLTDADRELLDYLATLPDLTAAATEPALFARYGNVTRVWQRVNALLDFPPAAEYSPAVVGRLTRLREQRRRVMRRPKRSTGYPADGHQ